MTKRQNLFEAITYGLMGMVAASGWLYSAPVTLLILPLWLGRSSKVAAFSLFFGYYICFSFGAPDAFSKFFPDAWYGWAIAAWIIHAAIISLPWIFASAQGRSIKQQSIAISIILFATLIPPIGAFNWGHPMMLAGYLFPGSGLFGMLLFSILFVGLAWKSRAPELKDRQNNFATAIIALIVFASILLNATYQESARNNEWIAVNTQFGSSASGDVAHERHHKMSTFALEYPASKLVIFPEEVGLIWNERLQNQWLANKTFKSARALVGVDVERGNDASLNALIDPLTGRIIASARVPMPMGNWRPWGESSDSRMFGLNAISIDGQTASILFCYEETIFYPMMADVVFGGAKEVISVANVWSTSESARQKQEMSVVMQTRLWGIPLTRAVNY